MSAYSEYSLDTEIAAFFSQTSATRQACDLKAKDLVGGDEPVPVLVQGVCSYTVYAGPESQYVVQFRLKSLLLKSEMTDLAYRIYGSLVPTVSFHGHLGSSDEDKEPLLIYVMSRIRGISHLDFILANGCPENSESNFVWRKTLMTDLARFFAVAWKAPQKAKPEYLESLLNTYTQELELLLASLPSRYHQAIQHCLDSMDDIMALPCVLVHRDFGSSNILVDENSCHLTGVIDWAEAEICPFGQNLHSLQAFTGALHLKNGWRRYDDYQTLQNVFWNTFQEEVGGLDVKTLKTIKTARIMGLLRSRGFTKRLANMPEPLPICDDEHGRYNMLSLDGFLVNPNTRFDGLA